MNLKQNVFSPQQKKTNKEWTKIAPKVDNKISQVTFDLVIWAWIKYDIFVVIKTRSAYSLTHFQYKFTYLFRKQLV